jgi:hypothetical protein
LLNPEEERYRKIYEEIQLQEELVKNLKRQEEQRQD